MPRRSTQVLGTRFPAGASSLARVGQAAQPTQPGNQPKVGVNGSRPGCWARETRLAKPERALWRAGVLAASTGQCRRISERPP
jgi:hypothetical protein